MKKITLFLMALFVAIATINATETIDFSAQGYTDKAEIENAYDGTNVSITFGKGTYQNLPKYYNSGTAVRFYAGNTMTLKVKNSHKIKGLAFVWGVYGDYIVPTTGMLSVDAGSYDFTNSTWTDANGVTELTITNTHTKQHRLKKVVVYFENDGDVTPEEGSTDTPTTPPTTPTEEPTSAQKVTVTEFLAAAVSTTTWYEVTGVVSNIANTTYGNFDLTDETGTVYVYGLVGKYVGTNDKTFATLNVAEGDTITVWGVRSEYNSEAQMGTSKIPAILKELRKGKIEYSDVANIKEFIAKADSTGYTRITGAVNVTVQNGKQVYVQDATGALVIYGATATYETGDALTGIIGKYDNYNGTPEMVSPIFPEEVSAGSVEPKSVLLKNVNAALVSYYVKVVGEVVEDVTFVTDSASNMTLRDAAGNTIVARNKFKFAAEFFEEDLIEVTAVVDLFNGEPQLGVISYDWADEFPVAVENVYVNNIYTENGLVVADSEFAIFTITGQDVTAMNGRLENGIYIVKTAKSAVKVVVK